MISPDIEKIKLEYLIRLLSSTTTTINPCDIRQPSQITPNLYLDGKYEIVFFIILHFITLIVYDYCVYFFSNYFSYQLRHELYKLKQMGITHVVNCASPVLKDGKEIRESILNSVELGANHYRKIGIKESNYLALPVLDRSDFDISQFFDSSARFIDSAISPPTDMSGPSNEKAFAECKSGATRSNGIVVMEALNTAKVLVHCAAGRSRSATIVIAYLLMRLRDPLPTLEAAIRFVKSRREIHPNVGFIRQLMQLELRLRISRQLERVRLTTETDNTSNVQSNEHVEATTNPTSFNKVNKPEKYVTISRNGANDIIQLVNDSLGEGKKRL